MNLTVNNSFRFRKKTTKQSIRTTYVLNQSSNNLRETTKFNRSDSSKLNYNQDIQLLKIFDTTSSKLIIFCYPLRRIAIL